MVTGAISDVHHIGSRTTEDFVRCWHITSILELTLDDPGDSRSVGQGVLEMRIDYGPGYRVYYVHRGAQIVILLCAGDKRTQQQDIKKALREAETR